MTAREFLEAYAERSGVTVEDLLVRDGRVVVTCSCGEEGCDGFALLSREMAEDTVELYRHQILIAT